MTLNQIAVILAGLFGGYWIVSKLFMANTDAAKPPPAQEQEREAPRSEQSKSGERPPPPQNWSEVLGISSSAGLDEIRRAYRGMIVQYHPDKVASLGRELKDLAEAKSKQITMAYYEAMRARGVDK